MKPAKLFLIASVGLLLLPGCGLPAKKQIDVPFTSQAPAGDWSEPWQDACEETSIYMVSSFYQDDPIKRDEAIAHIKEILAVKNSTFKVSHDESLEEIAALIKTLGLPWDTEIKYDPTEEDLKGEVAKNRPVIVPVYSPSLWSATYHGGGADYHVLVLTGYDDKAGVFIVNDPGSGSGEGIRFPYKTFMNAIHDLNAKNYKAGTKAVLFTHAVDWKLWLQSFTTTK
jgi:hypothetical protein